MSLHRRPSEQRQDAILDVNPVYAQPVMDKVPKNRLPDEPMNPDTAYQIVHDELLLDGNARTNLATFVTTWMEPQGRRLMAECAEKNMIDKDEYPQTAELERRCVQMLGTLWNAPGEPVGCSTTGSSEACMLGGLALKRRWQTRTSSAEKPNLVMGANVQVVWEKFCNYWDVEARLVPMEGNRFHLDAETAVARCDENTIGVVGILGSTFDGSYEPIAEIAAALDDLQERTGTDVPIHVDGASGALVAPFELLTDGSELPAFAFKLRDDRDAYSVYDVSARLREGGWIVPAYRFPENRDDLHVLRVVVRNGFSHDLADLFLDEVERALSELERQPKRRALRHPTAFHH